VYRCPICHHRVEGDGPCPRDGSPAPASPSDEAVEIRPVALDGYAIGGTLGAGGFAVVWSARRAADGAPVAIKVGQRDDAIQEARFRREAEALRLVGSPHVPALHERGSLADGRPYLVMERLEGETLAALLAARGGPFGADEAVRVGDAVLVALEAAHLRGVVHRDLKPENVFVRMDPPSIRATLIDFGLTTAIAADDAGLTRTGAIVGTSEYMAPEQLRGDRSLDARADLYAFGVILYELCTGRPPFVGDMKSIEHGHLALRPPRPSTLAAVPAPLEDLMLACLAKDPRRRPESASVVRRALASAYVSPSVSVSVATSARPTSLVAEGRQPVVLLVVESPHAAAPVMAVIAAHRGVVARQRGRRFVGVFSGLHVDDPARAALSAARELVDRHGARAALHLAPVVLRWKERGAPSVFGAPVDRPETWIPKEPWSGLFLSDAMARVATAIEAATAESQLEGSAEDSAGAGPALVGRREELDAIGASVAEVFARQEPGLFTLLGGPGLGKSRLAARAAGLSRSARDDARILSFAAAPGAAITAGSLTARVLSRALSAPEAPPDDARAFCVAHLGEQIGAEVWPAVAAALGWPVAADDATNLGRQRHALMRAIAEALRRLAERRPTALILDDAHWADDIVLDALEYATLVGERCPLWVLVAAAPRFEQARPSWGTRAQHRWKRTLSPLDAAASAELAAKLLEPAEYPPAAVLKRLAEWSGGNPFSLSEIVLGLKRAGIVKQRPNGGAFYVATAELDSLPPSPAWQWLAARQLESLTPELAALVRLCAVLGADFDRDEVEAVQDALDRAGVAGTPVDVDYGLGALSDRGVLHRNGTRYAFESALAHDAIYEMVDAAQREQVHRAALGYHEGRAKAAEDTVALAALARHAGACGAREKAAEAYLLLGDSALARHRHVEADQHYSAALGLAEDGDARRRARALAGRAKSRYLMWRTGDALSDLALARALAEAIGDRALEASILLEEATALDWLHRFEESAQRVEAAASIVEAMSDGRLESRLLLGRARTSHRRAMDLQQIDVAAAIAHLEAAVAAADARDDYESRVIGRLLLGPDLAAIGDLSQSERRFDEVIALTRAADDWSHLTGAYVNRLHLWSARVMPEQASSDLREVLELSRQIGNVHLEIVGTSLAAKFLYSSGHFAEAVPLARRAWLLEGRFADHRIPRYALLLSRALLASERDAESAEVADWIRVNCPPKRAAHVWYVYYQTIRLALREVLPGAGVGADETWDSLLALMGDDTKLDAEDRFEVFYWRARTALQSGREQEAATALDAARRMLAGAPFDAGRFAMLEAAASRDLHSRAP
jgi:hypothetical protein